MEERRLSILINAYACSPNMGSEPGMAWNWCVNLAQYCDLYIITEEEFKKEIEKVLPCIPQGKHMHFYFNPVTPKVRKMCWNQGDWRFYHYYRKWQCITYEIACEIIQNNQIDIIHQLNMIGFREPGFLWKIDKPYIWGPIGGIGSIPFPFLIKGKTNDFLFYTIKNIISKIQLSFSSRVKKALRKADYILVATSEGEKAILKYHHRRSILINETSCTLEDSKDSDIIYQRNNKKTFDILWVGRFIYTKQLKLALDVLSKLKAFPDIRFHIVGQAFLQEETNRMIEYASEIGIEDKCVFYKQISHQEVANLMRKSDLFFFTSIFEATSTVILEAISNQLPILCFNICGFGPIVDENIGIRIEMNTPNKASQEFADKIIYLYNNRSVLNRMSENCILKQQELSWENKIKSVLELYNTIIFSGKPN